MDGSYHVPLFTGQALYHEIVLKQTIIGSKERLTVVEKKIVFFDLDGTLLNEDKIVLESTKQALRALQEKGVYTVISTGRAPLMFDWLCRELAIDSFVSMNGQHVIHEGEELFSNPIDADILHDLATYARKQGHGLSYSNHLAFAVSEENHPFIQPSINGLKLEFPPANFEFYLQNSVHQVQVYCESRDAGQYMNRYADFTFIQWGEYAFDMLPEGASKAVGIRKLLEKLGIPRENSYAFGDGRNDIEMLEYVGTGVAMDNAVPELKDIADHVTTSCSEDGILDGLLHIGLLETIDVMTVK